MAKSNRLQRLKKIIFEKYSRNLSWVKEHPDISFEPDFDNGYVCPLCFEVFTEHDLNPDSNNPLTFDHTPPEALGGKTGILTCKKCNSQSGGMLDVQLLKRLEEIDFFEMTPNAQMRIELHQDNKRVAADFTVTDTQGLVINLSRRHSNPKNVDAFLNSKKYSFKPIDSKTTEENFHEYGFNWRIDFAMNPLLQSDERRSEIALLKIAYLLAFQHLGNSFLVNPGLYKVRQQIQNPDKEILPKVFWIKYEFPENLVGLNIVNKPKELLCFLVIFNLATKNKSRQFAIALPGFSVPGVNIYNNLEKILCKNGNGNIEANIEHLYNWDYVSQKKLTFAAHQYWQALTKKFE